jgi:hypothetical protein
VKTTYDYRPGLFFVMAYAITWIICFSECMSDRSRDTSLMQDSSVWAALWDQ